MDDYADSGEPMQEGRQLIDSVIDVILAAFTDYTDRIDELDLPIGGDTRILEPLDDVTRYCLNPFYLVEYFDKIREFFQGRDVMLSNLGNGSTRIGLLFATEMRSKVRDYVPFRLSCYKHKDKAPNIGRWDVERLASEDGSLFITDGDRSSGRTLGVCNRYMSSVGLHPVFGCVFTTRDPVEGGVIPTVFAREF